MRVRVLLAGAGVALVALVGAPGAARAQEGEGEVDISHEAEECLELLEQGKDVDDCQEAPSLILPETSEIVWGSISFVVLLAALRKFAWPGMKKGMEDRSERVRRDLAEAEAAKASATQVLEDYQRQLADARNESGRIIEEARQSADAMRRELQARAETDIAELRQRAAADVESAKAQSIADLRAEVASLAIGAAEVVVQHNLDHDTQVQLIENYINQVGSRS